MVAQERDNKSLSTVYLVVGESGSGKDTLVNVLCDEFNLNKVKSYTTREARNAEDHNNHIFATEDDYYKAKVQKSIIAETHFNGNYYWATIDQVQNADFYIIDPRGVRRFLNMYPMLVPSHMEKNIQIIYIKSTAWERIFRMYQREKENCKSVFKLIIKVLKRFINDLDEFEDFERKADYTIRNKHNHFEDALIRFTGIIAMNNK